MNHMKPETKSCFSPKEKQKGWVYTSQGVLQVTVNMVGMNESIVMFKKPEGFFVGMKIPNNAFIAME